MHDLVKKSRSADFLQEPVPDYGRAVPVADGVLRIVAPNPGVMTYHGTNSYLVGTAEGTLAIDPGPDDAGHVQAILRAAPGGLRAIVLTHGHGDHAGAADALRRVDRGDQRAEAGRVAPTRRMAAAAWASSALVPGCRPSGAGEKSPSVRAVSARACRVVCSLGTGACGSKRV